MVEGKITLKVPVFQWEIDINSFSDKQIGDFVQSPTFFTENSCNIKNEWCLKLYPKGDTKSAQGYSSIFLFNLTNKNIVASFSLSLFNKDMVKTKVKTIENHLFKVDNNLGFPKFFEETFIMDPKNQFLKDNKLIISCKIITKEDFVENIGANVQTEKDSCRLQEFDRFEKLLTNSEFSDVTISTSSKKFYLHKCILTSCSDVFEAMFRNDMKEKNQNLVEITDIKDEVLDELFLFVYTGKINNVKDEIVCELLVAAEKYQITGLKALSEETLCTYLTVNNAVSYLNLAIMNNAKKLRKTALNLIALYLKEFIENPEFEKFEKQHPGLLFEIMKKHIHE